MRRSQLRDQIFQLLFRVEYHPAQEFQTQEKLFVDERADMLSSEDAEYICGKYEKILSHLEEIDSLINSETEGWDTGRIAKTDLAIIRLAIYEIKYDDEVGMCEKDTMAEREVEKERETRQWLPGPLSEMAAHIWVNH